jgi:cardiolipin synthase C
MIHAITRRYVHATVSVLCLAITLAGCASLRREVPRPPSEAWKQPEQTTIGREVGVQLAGHAGQSGFHLLSSGLEALSLRAGLAANAQRTLDLQYYTLHEDITTHLLLYRVLRAANQGVRVRLLIDDLSAVGRDFDLATFSAHSNIKVRVFNPFLRRGPLGLSRLLEFLGDSKRLNRRMHNKLWIADNAAAIMGGRNLGDQYFDAHSEINFTDLDILAAGPVVRELSRSFDEYWNSEWAVPVEAFVFNPPGPEHLARFERTLETRLQGFRDTVYARALREVRLGPQFLAGQLKLTPAPATALYDKPAKAPGGEAKEPSRPIFSSRLRSIIEAAKNEVILISPYFIPSERGIGALSALVRRGVRVRILTNSLASTDMPVVHAGYARVRVRLLAAGVEMYEMRPNEPPKAGRSWRTGASSGASLHAKAVLVDRRQVLVGSMNLDPRSRLHNTEVAVLLESAQIGADLATLFEEAVQPVRAFRVVLTGAVPEQTTLLWITEEDGKEVHYNQEPAGFWRRFFSGVLGSLAPDELL